MNDLTETAHADNAKTSKTKTSKTKTMTPAQIAAEYNMQPKTLRARMRRNKEAWEALHTREGKRYVFKDNATTRKRIAELLNA